VTGGKCGLIFFKSRVKYRKSIEEAKTGRRGKGRGKEKKGRRR